MKQAIFGLILATAFAASASAQVDSCSGAMSALNRAKGEITPDLAARNKAKDEYAGTRIKTMLTTLVAAAEVCGDQPELLYYRALLAREANSKDRVYYERKLKESGYQSACARPGSEWRELHHSQRHGPERAGEALRHLRAKDRSGPDAESRNQVAARGAVSRHLF
jgi:hypothetical protein